MKIILFSINRNILEDLNDLKVGNLHLTFLI